MPGAELLIVDGVASDREGMRAYFDGKGYVCTCVATGAEARRLVEQKFFAAALVDLDTDQPNAGVDVARHIRQTSRHTSVVLLTARSSFDAAVDALRVGVLDIVRKSPDSYDYLGQVIGRATAHDEAKRGGDDLYREVRAVLDESFKVMLALSRKVYAHLSLAAAPVKPRILIVDSDAGFLKELSQLVGSKSWDVAGEMNGGGALDRGMSAKLDIVASRDELPDLRGSMVLRSIQAQHGEVLGLLYSAADGAGRIDRFEQGQTESTERPFGGAAHLVQRIEDLAEELGTRAQERRFIQAFSADHRDFLRRYADLKLKIDRLISD